MNNIVYLFNPNRNNKINLFKDYILNSNNKLILNFLNFFFDNSLDSNSKIVFIKDNYCERILNYSFCNYDNSIIMHIGNYKYIIELNLNTKISTINLFKLPLESKKNKSISINIPQMVIIELNQNPLNTGTKNLEINFNNNYFAFKVPVFNLFNQSITKLKENNLQLLIHFKSNSN